MSKYRVTKKLIHNKRKYERGETVNLQGNEAQTFYETGCVDNQDRRDRKNRIKHELDKRNH